MKIELQGVLIDVDYIGRREKIPASVNADDGIRLEIIDVRSDNDILPLLSDSQVKEIAETIFVAIRNIK